MYLAFDSLCGAQMGVAERVLAFNSLCEARTGVGERHRDEVSDQLSDRLIFGRLFQANERLYCISIYASL